MTDVNESVFDHLTLVFYEDLRLCGCGDPNSAWVLIRDLLEHFSRPYSPEADSELSLLIGTPPAIHIVVSALDGAELIEHGTSYWSSWLTAKGKWLLWALNTVGLDDLDQRLEEHGYPHYEPEAADAADCTEDCWRIPVAEERS